MMKGHKGAANRSGGGNAKCMADMIDDMKNKGLLQKPKSPKNWIAGAIKHPGSFTRSAKRAGESVHAYAEDKKNAGGVLGKRARLALTLSKLSKKG